MKKRFLLNISMILILLPLYNTKIIPLMLHEIAGIGVFALFGIHISVNRKWKANPIERAITILLGLSFVFVLVSGIAISHELFPRAIKAPHLWHTIHLATALLALLLSVAHTIQHRKSMLAIMGKHKWKKALFVAVAIGFAAFFAVRTGMLLGGFGEKSGQNNGQGIHNGQGFHNGLDKKEGERK